MVSNREKGRCGESLRKSIRCKMYAGFYAGLHHHHAVDNCHLAEDGRGLAKGLFETQEEWRVLIVRKRHTAVNG